VASSDPGACCREPASIYMLPITCRATARVRSIQRIRLASLLKENCLAPKVLLSANSEWPETLISEDPRHPGRPYLPRKLAESKQSVCEVFLLAK